MNLEKVFAHNQEWVNKRLGQDEHYFDKLSAGQNPEILYIGCSDSRVTAEELLGAEPGEVFVHRNIANMVISLDMNTTSVLAYAVEHLKVKHIVVCGHYNCGGIKSAMIPKDLGIMNPWLRNIRDVYRLHSEELNAIENEGMRYNRLVELNVQEQCVNVVKNPFVQRAMENGLIVHGWVFDLFTGKLIDLNLNFDLILENIKEIYDINE
ncbi:carbonic anhydrase [Empedobacter stercoris]|mgnify:FL=1|uniref:carbonic anhydrase n=1 Tax=Empedobacter stercoris TaxID=1628248 RepID=A0ABX1WJA0_9FLAO|nr:carbonic anhydrase [Empedobacter stercoris]HJD86584.1 carbonic anhydrase [Empedobacter falsenii]MCA4776377.1 carbonic anhydrase [Empedobacter stercoris]MCA4809322.1 carbonic anhydrase [Empedobacter stercoris]NOJ74627.1 carbonic anhydrase [Empedobacter stercoris]QNT14790.1 carbonic anhydrase [Empedobacter stercoris]